MKLLTSLFRKFPFFNALNSSISLIIISILSLAIIVTVSCRLRQEFSAKNSESETHAYIDFIHQSSTSNQGIVVARLDERYCEKNSNGQEVWEVQFTSPMGQHRARLNYAFAAVGEAIQVTIDDETYLVPLTHPVPAAELAEACARYREGQKTLKLSSDTIISEWQNVMNTIAPACDFDHSEKGWKCQLQTAQPGQILDRLKEMRRVMVTRWSRHPYLLTRRVAITVSLANALVSRDSAKDLDSFCKVLTHSLPEELPLALRTQDWQQHVCTKPTDSRYDIAKLGLREAETEIETLKNELEETSKLGTLNVRIPAGASPSKDFWITLNPVTPDPALQREHYAVDVRNLCWHPLYHHNTSMKTVAAELGLIETKNFNHCRQTVAVEKGRDAIETNYIISSITSETEFPITNGHSKLLRLPEGDYHYMLQKHLPEDPWETPPTSEVSQGTISWKSKRPRSTISKW